MRNGHFNPVVVAFPDAILGRDGGRLLSKHGDAALARLAARMLLYSAEPDRPAKADS
jgi:hypothetical protein